ncbi:hypothetical protein K9N68_15460 [Kovacikia minuta CCNUW1]|uniref:hypothetical protein n=1 Tax=Kovacikia minuta TaxID=2931930 RepID=UPI001CC936C8|nr:hypothetical protein [Kovacikia minuta]UBF29104.1 hypothetical protein K9N68_15460 [Kovacikia minuta CCNUW1]
MTRLKRWESPRREGRNDKGKGGSARQRQRRKQFQSLRKKLKEQSDNQNQPGEANQLPLLFWELGMREGERIKDEG